MAILLQTCPRFLEVLGEFYRSLPEPLPLEAVMVEPGDVPEPYHDLLVHEKDMTPTLTAHFGEEINLRVLQRELSGNHFRRHIVLEGAWSGRAVEYGAIRIDLDVLGEAARREVIECRTPLGAILGSHGIMHKSCPGGFFRILSNPLIDRALALKGPQWLYGRCNCLASGTRRTIAEVVEILPSIPRNE
jgi:hypothetical protein